MKSTQFFLSALIGLASAGPVVRRSIVKREVPQEHSHELYLSITREFLNAGDNPLQIDDPVFGLLGNAAAAAGVGADINLDCLKQFTADQAFTNAKALGDVRGMAGALVYQAIERNTGGVGVKSVICPEDAVNPEIAAFDQHQDPASDGAAATNKAITLELAKQLALIGVDPLLALESGTFAPGDPNDNTGAGNSCDDQNDPIGCIFTQDLLVLDATPDEVLSAVDGITPTFTGTGTIEATNINFNGISVAGGGTLDSAGATAVANEAAATASEAAAATTKASSGAACTIVVKKGKSSTIVAETAAATSTCSVVTTTVPAAMAATMAGTTVTAAAASGAADATAADGVNVQKFTGTLGGAPPPVISSNAERPFEVKGSTFIGANAAISRSCDVQHNACANAANSGQLDGGVGQCETQLQECRQANNLRKRQASAFGSCSDPTIEFGVGFDGRKEGSFQPVDKADFNHGSAQKIGIISSFICQRLQDSCKADADVVKTCNDASAQAQADTQDQTAADTFNRVLTGANASGGASSTATASAADATASSGMVVMEVTVCN